ncbi:MAG: DNA-3-methyladenine glycosylase family protein [Fluviicola sp.]
MNEAQIHLGSSDPVLKQIIASIDLPKPIDSNSVFHDLMACTIEQQIPYRSSKKTFEKLLKKASISVLTPENFGTFEKQALHDIKLSESKYATIQRILDQWKEMPQNWHELSKLEVRSAFNQIKGIGPWTVDMILMYTLGFPDIFPSDDYHLKQIMPHLYDLNPKSRLKAQMKNVAENWSPYRSVATRYLLEWKKFGRLK